MTLELISLNELNPDYKNKRIHELAVIFKDFNFNFYENLQIVSRILIENGFYEIALNIIFNKAIVPGNLQARIDYFFACIQMPIGIIKEIDIVEIGCFVKYVLNNEVKFIEIIPGNILADELIGHKKGDTIIIERPFLKSFDSIQILRIMDKYLNLHDEINEEVKSNPYSGFPMQSIEFKDVTPEGMINTFVTLFGTDGSILKERQENAHKEYYSYKLSFSELIFQIYSHDYVGGYFNLVHSKNGITQIPSIMYPKNLTFDDKEFVIDFSSLIILHQISLEHKIEFKNKFLIAKAFVDLLRGYLKRERLEPKEQMYIDVTLDGVKSNIRPESASERNIKYLEKLIDWIKFNCIETIVESKLDLIRKLNDSMKNDLFITLVIENISILLENENRILITDDSICFKFYPLQSGKSISSELYVKSVVSNNEECLQEFVKNKYIGYTINAETLLQEFNKKIKGQPNFYAHCLNNASLGLIPSTDTIFTVVIFLKQLAIDPILSQEIFKQEATNALINLLKGQNDAIPFEHTKFLITKEFKLLGFKLDTMLECYSNALLIIGFGK